MSEPRWKRLVEELRAAGHESPSMERLEKLHARLGCGASQRDLEREIMEEMASALARAAEKVDVAILELALLGKKIDALPAFDASTASMIAAFNAQREVAKRALWELTVHREAIGFRRSDKLAELYPIPPPRRPPPEPDA